MELHEKIKAKRKEMGLTQTQLSRAIGLKHNSDISRIEGGYYTNKRLLKNVCEFLGVEFSIADPKELLENEKVDVGTLVKYKRESLGLTQRQLGQLIGFKPTCCQMYISQMERGIVPSSYANFKKICDYLGIDIEIKYPQKHETTEIKVLDGQKESNGTHVSEVVPAPSSPVSIKRTSTLVSSMTVDAKKFDNLSVPEKEVKDLAKKIIENLDTISVERIFNMTFHMQKDTVKIVSVIDLD